MATRTQNVLGERGRRIRELTSVVQKRFGFAEGTVEVCVFSCLLFRIPIPIAAIC
jgi:ribosomal protein S3